MFGLVGVFLLIAGGELIFGLIEAAVRIWDDEYHTGFPSIWSLVWAYGVLFLLCAVMLIAAGAVERGGSRDRR